MVSHKGWRRSDIKLSFNETRTIWLNNPPFRSRKSSLKAIGSGQ
jgi:hypothetical protein